MGLTDCHYCLSFLSKVHKDLCVPSQRQALELPQGICEVRKDPQGSPLFRNQACLMYQLGLGSTTCDWKPQITVLKC